MKSDRVSMLVGAVLVLAVAGMASAAETGSAFTYQGQLKEAGLPVNEPADFEFTLWDAAGGGNPIGSAVELCDIDVDNGLFTVVLDFGANVFTGEARWLEIAVAVPAGSGPWHTLSPRQPVTAAPYALYALDGPGVGGFWDPAGDNIYNTNSGYVGIGTDEPLAKLHVSGDTRLDGTLNVDTSEPGHMELDQSQELASLVSHLDCDWQAFVPSMDGHLVRVEVLSDPEWYWGMATLTVYGGEGTSGPVVCQRDENIGWPPDDGVVTFDIPVEEACELTAGELYTFEVCRSDAIIKLAPGDPYPPGDCSFGPDYDLWFRTYMNADYNPGGKVTVTADGNVGIGTNSPVVRLDVAGAVKITKVVPDIPPDEFVDIDVNYDTIAALYSIVVQDSGNGSNINQYMLMFIGGYYGCAVTILDSVHPPGVPVVIGAEFGGVGSGPAGPYKLQIRHGLSRAVNVYITKIHTYH